MLMGCVVVLLLVLSRTQVWAIMDEDGGGTVTWDEFDRWFGVLEDTSRTRFDAEKVIQVSEETWESLLEAVRTHARTHSHTRVR
jgi:hypothetical protein